ncbi:hypothetical protein ABDK56_07505 [Sphingomonas sp. ASV193]|uniref:hypothetical protein n=1 Tax=Sphingomonas sp. ASV193 TaxID=3144405 RepID=UPI0032E934D3
MIAVPPRWVAGLTLALLLALVAGVTSCRHRAVRAEAARVEAGQHSAATESGHDAIETVANAAARDAGDEALTRTNEKEIRNARGANDRVDDAVTRAGIDGLCRRAAYRDGERCRLRGAAAR